MTVMEPDELPRLADCLPPHLLPLPESYKDCLVRELSIDEGNSVGGVFHRVWSELDRCKLLKAATAVAAVIVDDAGNTFSVTRTLPAAWSRVPLAFDVRTPPWGTTKSWLGGFLNTHGVRVGR